MQEASREFWLLQNGTPLEGVHPAETCVGNCPLHNPSEHPMQDFPLHWRNDVGLFERICPHGIGHPDPDDLAFKEAQGRRGFGVHGCDRCCVNGAAGERQDP